MAVKEAFTKERLQQEMLAEKHPGNKHITAQEWDNFLNVDGPSGAVQLSKETRILHNEIVTALLEKKDD